MTIVSRVAALVVAVGLVLGAVALRGGAEGRTGDGPAPAAAPVVVACPRDLARLCDGVDAVASLGVDRVATEDLAASAATAPLEAPWLVPTSWADVVDDDRGRAGADPLLRTEVVLSSPLVLVGFEERIAGVARICGVEPAEVTLACLVGVADRRWGEFEGEDPGWGRIGLGHGPPSSTVGLLATAAVAEAVAGPAFGARELAAPEAAATFRELERSVREFDPGPGGHVRALRIRGPSVADLVVAPEADTIGMNDPQPPSGPLVAWAAEPLLVVELVLVADDQAQLDGARRLLLGSDGRDAVDGAGWRLGAPPEGTTIGELPEPAPRPDAPSLIALRSAWDELAP